MLKVKGFIEYKAKVDRDSMTLFTRKLGAKVNVQQDIT